MSSEAKAEGAAVFDMSENKKHKKWFFGQRYMCVQYSRIFVRVEVMLRSEYNNKSIGQSVMAGN